MDRVGGREYPPGFDFWAICIICKSPVVGVAFIPGETVCHLECSGKLGPS